VTGVVWPGETVAGNMLVIAGDPTMKPLKGAAAPPGVITVTVRDPGVASGAIVITTPTLVVATDVRDAVTPVPLNVTAVAPERVCPKIVAAIVVPGAPEAGLSEEIDGSATVKVATGVTAPEDVVTNTVRGPAAAPGAMLTASDTDVAATDVRRAVTSLPLKTTPDMPDKLCPNSVATTLVPGAPVDGVMKEPFGTSTVNPLNVIAPSGVWTVIKCNPCSAPGLMVTTTVNVVAAAEVISAVTPDPLKVTAVAFARFVPRIVTGIGTPGSPLSGEMVLTVGGAACGAGEEDPAFRKST